MNITDKDIHLWLVNDEEIDDPSLLARYQDILNLTESNRQRRFRFTKHRHRYLVTHTLIRVVLSLYVDSIAPARWRFEENNYGKPYINGDSLDLSLKFNVSHTDKLIVLAVALNDEIGVDVEHIHKQRKILEIARSAFAPNELAHLGTLAPAQRIARFYDIWTLKEAYIKACGMGLSIPLDQFAFEFPSQDRLEISFDVRRRDDPSHWHFWQFEPTESHKVSLALRSVGVRYPYAISTYRILPLVKSTQINCPITRQSNVSRS